MSQTQLTFPEARTLVLCECETFNAQHGDDNTDDWGQALGDLQLKLSYWLGGRIHYLLSVTTVLDELADLDNGDHGALKQTANGAIDEGGWISDRLNAQLHDALYYVVTAAGIDATLRAVAA